MIKNMFSDKSDNIDIIDLDTISPSLVTNPGSTYTEYNNDMLLKLGYCIIPLYNRQEYCILPRSSMLSIVTDDSDEAIYYSDLELVNTSIIVNPNPITGKSYTDYSKLYSSIIDRNVDNIDFLSDESFNQIGGFALSSCVNLTEITVPGNIKSVGYSAFSNCSNVTKLVVENGVESFGNGCFSGCTSLTDVNLPETLTSVETGVFANCSSLEELEIPEGITSIPVSFTGGCGKLKHITIPSTVTSIASNAFSGVGYALSQDQNVVITINKPEGSISGSPWGTAHATTVEWIG